VNVVKNEITTQRLTTKIALRLTHPIHALGLLYALVLSSWVFTSQYYGDITLFEFLLPSLILMLITYVSWCVFKAQSIPLRLSDIIIWAIIFRLIGLMIYPILEDDAFRYMWDGYQTLINGSPYRQPPSYFFSVDGLSDRFNTILDHINYPDVPTIYWPTTQYVFALAAWIAPGEIWPLQFLMLCFDVVLLYVLCQLGKPLCVWLYAWSPLVIKETIITAHPDIIGIAFIWLAFLYQRKNIYIAASCCAFAVSAKVFAVLLVPFCLLFIVRAWCVFLLVLVCTFLPFMHEIPNLVSSLSAMSEGWVFNSPLYLIVLYTLPSVSLSTVKISLFLMFAVFGLYLFCKHVKYRRNMLVRGDIIFMMFLLVSPVANPWYFLWILPFAVIYPSLWAWVASCAVFLSYCIGLNLHDPALNNYQIPAYIVVIEYGLIFIALCITRLKRFTLFKL